MARLRVRLRGKITQEILLSEERTYMAGRREDCDIPLGGDKGLSREHFKIFFAENHWNIEVLSRFGDVVLEGEPIQQRALDGKQLFYLGPYEFEYSETTSDLVLSPQAQASEDGYSPGLAEAGENDKTLIGSSPTIPYIKVVTEAGDVKELFKLEGGDLWVAGRDSSCEIVIRDQRVSRRQFEVRRYGSGFQILDLGSVNGTLVNGSSVSATDPMTLKSGDAISVLDNHLYFELHDPAFKARMEIIKANTPSPLVAVSQDIVPAGGYYPPQMAYPNAQVPMGYGYPPMDGTGMPHAEGPKKFDFEKHRVKLIAGALLFLGLAYYVSSQEGPPKPTPQQGAQKPQDIFNKLSPEQQILVKQTYMLAKNLYMQGKYELAKTEVAKIYELVPEYEDTKDIERLANEALVIQDQKRRQEELERSRAESEARIQKQVAECKNKINPDMTSEQLEECLAPALEFAPEHQAFMELRQRVAELVSLRQAKDAQRAEYQSQVQKLRNLFNRAENSHRGNEFLVAIKQYQAVTGSNLPDPGELKSQARRQIAAIQQTLKQKTEQFDQEAEQHYKDQKLKEAILILRKSVDVDPNNDEAKDRIARYTLELKKQMMILYQEGVLEESYGNVDGSESRPGAKDRWKKIMETDIPDGEYYGKAKIKLKKYGAL